MTTQKRIKENIIYTRLDAEEHGILSDFMKSTGANKSSSVRLIIREWAQLKKDRANLLSNKLDRDNPYWLTEAGIEQSR